MLMHAADVNQDDTYVHTHSNGYADRADLWNCSFCCSHLRFTCVSLDDLSIVAVGLAPHHPIVAKRKQIASCTRTLCSLSNHTLAQQTVCTDTGCSLNGFGFFVSLLGR